ALVVGGRAEVVGGAGDDPLYQRRGRSVAAVGLHVRLDDQRRRGRGLGAGRAGTAGRPDRRRVAAVVDVRAPDEVRGVVAAQRPAAVTGGDHVDRVRVELGDAVRAERGDVVVLPATWRKLRTVAGGLPVDPVGGGPAHRDHAGRGGR